MVKKSSTNITTDLKMQLISMFILGRRYEMKMKAAEDRMRALGKYKPYFLYSFSNFFYNCFIE
jgi:hypothetical protein